MVISAVMCQCEYRGASRLAKPKDSRSRSRSPDAVPADLVHSTESETQSRSNGYRHRLRYPSAPLPFADAHASSPHQNAELWGGWRQLCLWQALPLPAR